MAVASEKRFRVALSFPREHRRFVSEVASRLAESLGQERVLYDEFYEAEFARPNLDTHLQKLYGEESDLIVPCLSKHYGSNEWCGLEWRSIRELIKTGRAQDVMPVRFDMTKIPGLFSGDGYIWVDDRPPNVIAALILERLNRSEVSGLKPSSTLTPSGAAPRIAPSRLPRASAELFGREDELKALDDAWLDPQIHVVTLVAFGGVGKTSLVGTWMSRLATRDFGGADYFDWSFYSQGAREQGAVSADSFIDKALRFFGDGEMAESTASAWTKGERLAALIGSRRTLLVLDGLEPLQFAEPQRGELKDDGVRALLRGLAARNAGLCVVTTRESVEDLSQFRSTTAPERRLGRLSTEAGVALLEKFEVEGPRDELKALVSEVRGHALTLNIVGRFLKDAHGGDVRKRDVIDFQEADDEVQGGHAFRAMTAYEHWLAGSGEKGERQLAILRLLGLFDRPASTDCLAALRTPPAIAGLTEAIVSLRETSWNLSVKRLADAGLLLHEGAGSDETLDAHPLVREHFARRLQEQSPEAAKEAHGRLFDHLKDNTEHHPDTLDGLQPLYQAVMHGCRAGRQEEARADVYRDRISRGGEAYVVKKLGAFGADLGAVACFFDEPWSRVTPELGESAKAWLLNEAAFRLLALGRLREAIDPTRAGLELSVKQEVWESAARIATNLSHLELSLGDVDAGVRNAEKSVEYADRSGDEFLRMAFRTALADAKHQAGQLDEALKRFLEAESMQAERQPAFPRLYSMQGFQYCDLLLGPVQQAASGADGEVEAVRGNLDDVERRAVQTLEWVTTQNWILDIALDHLTLSRVRLYRALIDGTAVSDAESEIEQAVDGLRRAGTLDQLPRGLLTRAWLRHTQGRQDDAHADLDAAEQIALRGPMPLFLADIELYRARFFHDRKALAEARRLIDLHGYGRRLEEIAALETASLGWPAATAQG